MNKIERVDTVFRGGKPDKIPALFWFHYNKDFDAREMAEAHLKTYRETDVDIYKIQQEYIQALNTVVQKPEDWNKVKFPGRSSSVYQKLLDVVKRIVDAAGHEAMVFQTMYGPLKTAVQSCGYDLMMAHAKEAPDLLFAAVMNIAEAQTEWAAGFVEAGAAGIFYCAQNSEPDRFTREEFNKLVTTGDLPVLKAIEDKGGRILLHICGEWDYQFRSTPEWYTAYPATIYTWSIKDTGISLKKGREIFAGKPIMGGINNKGNIVKGSKESIVDEVNTVIASAGTTEGFMLTADCSLQGEGISHEKIRVAVDASHAYPV